MLLLSRAVSTEYFSRLQLSLMLIEIELLLIFKLWGWPGMSSLLQLSVGHPNRRQVGTSDTSVFIIGTLGKELSVSHWTRVILNLWAPKGLAVNAQMSEPLLGQFFTSFSKQMISDPIDFWSSKKHQLPTSPRTAGVTRIVLLAPDMFVCVSYT